MQLPSGTLTPAVGFSLLVPLLLDSFWASLTMMSLCDCKGLCPQFVPFRCFLPGFAVFILNFSFLSNFAYCLGRDSESLEVMC